jgi:hypothetical protein
MSTHMDETGTRTPLLRRFFRRSVWENIATSIIALGIVMLCQPLSLDLYTYSFVTTLIGTAMFIVVTKFPD